MVNLRCRHLKLEGIRHSRLSCHSHICFNSPAMSSNQLAPVISCPSKSWTAVVLCARTSKACFPGRRLCLQNPPAVSACRWWRFRTVSRSVRNINHLRFGMAALGFAYSPVWSIADVITVSTALVVAAAHENPLKRVMFEPSTCVSHREWLELLEENRVCIRLGGGKEEHICEIPSKLADEIQDLKPSNEACLDNEMQDLHALIREMRIVALHLPANVQEGGGLVLPNRPYADFLRNLMRRIAA